MSSLIWLNSNAKQVSRPFIEKVHQLERQRQDVEVLISETPEQVHRYAPLMCSNGHSRVIVGGGDGTSFSLINAFLRYQNGKPLPTFAFPYLGTGGGLSKACNSSSPLEEIIAVLDAEQLPEKQVPLIEISGEFANGQRLAPCSFTFAGTGVDAEVLQHYREGKVKGVAGYLLAGITTARRFRSSARALVTSSSLAEVIEQPGQEPFSELPVAAEEIGGGHSVTVGTTPYYGFGFTALPLAPYAAARQRMHVRISTGELGAFAKTMCSHPLGLWQGTLRTPLIKECTAYDLRWRYGGDPGLLQIAGELIGPVQEVYCRVNKSLPMVDFKELRFLLKN